MFGIRTPRRIPRHLTDIRAGHIAHILFAQIKVVEEFGREWFLQLIPFKRERQRTSADTIQNTCGSASHDPEHMLKCIQAPPDTIARFFGDVGSEFTGVLHIYSKHDPRANRQSGNFPSPKLSC